MGSEGPLDAVRFNVTGFGKFHGVADNPTTTLVSKLREHVKAPIHLESCTVLETAGEGALPALLELLNAPLKDMGPVTQAREEGQELNRKLLVEGKALPLPTGKILWIHLGVNNGASRFAIERRAYNEASFRCPDEGGWQPWKQPIVVEDGGLDSFRETRVRVDALVEALRQQGFDCAPSTDAGRFVCNYVYYHSLCHASAHHGTEALFVHVPSVEAVGYNIQFEFVEALLKTLDTLMTLII